MLEEYICERIVTPWLQQRALDRIIARGTTAFEYIEFVVEQERDYEIATNYGAW